MRKIVFRLYIMLKIISAMAGIQKLIIPPN